MFQTAFDIYFSTMIFVFGLRLVLGGLITVIQYAQLDGDAALRFAVGVGVAQGVGASAIFLLVEMLALADFNHACAAAAFAPVEIPINQSHRTVRQRDGRSR